MKYIVSYDIVVPGLVEVDAEDEGAAIEAVYTMSDEDLVANANTGSCSVLEGSAHIEDVLNDN